MTTSFFATHDFEMNISHLDQKMEMGTSPHPLMDDIDFDFEPDRQPSVDRSMADDAEALAHSTNAMHTDLDNIYNDDDMLDDETADQTLDDNIADFRMEQDDEAIILQQDDEILYDDDEEDVEGQAGEENASIDMTEQHGIAVTEDPASHQEDKEDKEEILTAEEDLEQHNNENNDNAITNVVTESNDSLEQQRIPKNEIVDENEEVGEQDHETDTIDTVDFADDPYASEPLVTGVKSRDPNDSEPDLRKEEAENEPQQDHAPTPSRLSTEGSMVQEDVSQPNESSKSGQADVAVVRSTTESLHPITVLYLGQEMSFFPPMMEDSSATFFLSDSKLAYEPVEKLLTSCRDILGDTLEHDDELVLDVPALGLHICEDSKYASQITLSQVSEVYVNLSRNEHIGEIEPLYCSLSSRVCLSSQYAYLAASAAEGKTYSEIAADYIDSPDHEVNSMVEGVEVDESNIIEEPNVPAIQDESLADGGDVPDSQNVHVEPDELPHDSQNSSAELNSGVPRIDSANAPSVEAIGSGDAQDDTEDKDASTVEGQPSIEDTNIQTLENHEDDADDDEADQSGFDDDIVTNNDTNEAAEHDDDASGSSHTVEAEDFIGWIEKPQHDFEESNLSYLNGEGNGEEISTNVDADTNENVLDNIESKENIIIDQHATNDLDAHTAVVGLESSKDHNLVQTEPDVAAEEPFVFDEEDDDVAAAETQIGNADESDLLQVEDLFAASAPITPSKHNGSKRKALDDEEDFDFLDFSTPEPKRTRAS